MSVPTSVAISAAALILVSAIDPGHRAVLQRPVARRILKGDRRHRGAGCAYHEHAAIEPRHAAAGIGGREEQQIALRPQRAERALQHIGREVSAARALANEVAQFAVDGGPLVRLLLYRPL